MASGCCGDDGSRIDLADSQQPIRTPNDSHVRQPRDGAREVRSVVQHTTVVFPGFGPVHRIEPAGSVDKCKPARAVDRLEQAGPFDRFEPRLVGPVVQRSVQTVPCDALKPIQLRPVEVLSDDPVEPFVQCVEPIIQCTKPII